MSVTAARGFRASGVTAGLKPSGRPDMALLVNDGPRAGACLALGSRAHQFSPGQHGTTFGGNPLASAVALAVLEVIEVDGLLANARQTGAELASVLAELPGVLRVRGRGLLLAAVLDEPVAATIAASGLDQRVIVNSCQPDVVRIAPPLVMGPAEVADARVRLAACWRSADERSAAAVVA